MDIIRAVAGSEPGEAMNFLGYSYGTRLGAEYAARFPDRVRTMVLDGAVDPDADPIEEIVAQAAGFQGAFDDYADDCTAGSNCPLGTDPDRAVAEFRALVDPLVDRPASTDDPRGLSYNDAMTGVQQALYSPGLWRLLTVGLRELRTGTGDTLLDLADQYEGRRSDGTYSNVDDAFNAIRCVDDPRITDRAVVGEADTRYRRGRTVPRRRPRHRAGAVGPVRVLAGADEPRHRRRRDPRVARRRGRLDHRGPGHAVPGRRRPRRPSRRHAGDLRGNPAHRRAFRGRVHRRRRRRLFRRNDAAACGSHMLTRRRVRVRVIDRIR